VYGDGVCPTLSWRQDRSVKYAYLRLFWEKIILEVKLDWSRPLQLQIQSVPTGEEVDHNSRHLDWKSCVGFGRFEGLRIVDVQTLSLDVVA
jgi:hypothetical protein